MKLLDARAFFALFAGSFVVATACGSERQFGTRSAGGASSEAGESGPNAGRTNHAGNGGTNHAGGSNGDAGSAGAGEEAGAAGEAGAGGVSNGEGGAGGEPGSPACGKPGEPCCASNMCITNATCAANGCACAPSYSACGDSCFNLKTDAKNCGVCGHSCLGGTCEGGACQPTTVATGQIHLGNMASDGTYLYWSGSSTTFMPFYVARTRVDGTGMIKVIAPNEQGAGALAVSANKVYWIAKGQLRSCDIPDCAAGPVNAIATATSGGVSGDLLYEPVKKTLYWSRGATYNTKDGTLYSLPDGTTMPAVVGPNPANPGALVSDAGNVYWINSSTYTTDNWNADGGLWRVRLSDGTTAQLASAMKGDISYLAIGGGTLFFAGNIAIAGSNPPTATGAILGAPLPNGLPAGAQPPKFVDARSVRGLEADDKYLYFADDFGTQSTISRCAVIGCSMAEILVPGLYQPNLGAQDATAIYFASSSSSATASFTIQRLAK